MSNSLKLFKIFIFKDCSSSFLLTRIEHTRTQLSWSSIKSSMFFSCTSSISFENSRDLRKSSSAAVCFLSDTCRTSKSNKRIHANQRIIKISEKSTAERLSWAIKVLTSISIINRTSYNQKRTFFNIFNSSWYSRFVTSYFDSNIIQKSLS